MATVQPIVAQDVRAGAQALLSLQDLVQRLVVRRAPVRRAPVRRAPVRQAPVRAQQVQLQRAQVLVQPQRPLRLRRVFQQEQPLILLYM